MAQQVERHDEGDKFRDRLDVNNDGLADLVTVTEDARGAIDERALTYGGEAVVVRGSTTAPPG